VASRCCAPEGTWAAGPVKIEQRATEICVDVPDLARGVRFYEDAFGFPKVSEPYRGVAVLAAGSARLTLLEKRRCS